MEDGDAPAARLRLVAVALVAVVHIALREAAAAKVRALQRLLKEKDAEIQNLRTSENLELQTLHSHPKPFQLK